MRNACARCDWTLNLRHSWRAHHKHRRSKRLKEGTHSILLLCLLHRDLVVCIFAHSHTSRGTHSLTEAPSQAEPQNVKREHHLLFRFPLFLFLLIANTHTLSHFYTRIQLSLVCVRRNAILLQASNCQVHNRRLVEIEYFIVFAPNDMGHIYSHIVP